MTSRHWHLRHKSAKDILKAFLFQTLSIQIRRVPKKGKESFPPTIDPNFPPLFRKYAHLTMVNWPGLYWAWQSATYVRDHRIPGDVVECGVFKGGCSLLMAEAHDRTAWMFDTFSGMAEPTEHDFKGLARGDRFNALERYHESKKDDHVDWCYGPLEDVQKAIGESNLDPNRFRCVKGKVEHTIPATAPDTIALLRLDTDFYESTKHELKHLYPRVSSGGIVLVDDYGSWAGSRKAVDEYFAKISPKPLSLPESSSAGLIVFKP